MKKKKLNKNSITSILKISDPFLMVYHFFEKKVGKKGIGKKKVNLKEWNFKFHFID